MTFNEPQGPPPESPATVATESQLPATIASPEETAVGWPLGGRTHWEETKAGEIISFSGFYHAMRRRGVMAVAIGAGLGLVLSVLVWLLIPLNYTVTMRFELQPARGGVMTGERDRINEAEYLRFQKTQATKLLSNGVLDACLAQPEVNALRIKADMEPAPKETLQRDIRISFPNNSTIMEVSYRSERPKEAIVLLKALRTEYLAANETTDHRTINENIQVLQTQYAQNKADIFAGTEEVLSIRQQLQLAGSPSAETRHRVEMQRLTRAEDRVSALRRQRDDIERKWQVLAAVPPAAQVEISSFELEDRMLSYPQYADVFAEMQAVRQLAQDSQGAGRGGVSKQASRYQTQMIAIQQRLDRVRQELLPRVRDAVLRERGYDDLERERQMGMLEVERRSLQENFQKAVDELQKQSEAVQLLSDGSADLETKTRELADLQRINSEIKNRLDKLRLEKDTTERIISERDPHQSETSDWLLKVAEVVAVFVMSLAATVFGIAIWDYRKHLVNQADDVTGMFGPRVLGALPQLSGGRLLGRASQEKVTSALNDSIDSIRTQFLYDKSEHPVRVIMVTSAVGQEGKTTVASQLAASLASAGRSTLLLDGDLRNPQQHLVWGASNDRGMCELIRGQATLDDVVRPTESEGLWLVPGGICDQAALQALTSETMDTLFDQLRARYDFVVIDAGPALVGADPLLIGQFADGTVLSVRRDVSQLRKVHDANDRLRSVGIDVVGTVVNGALPEIRKVG